MKQDAADTVPTSAREKLLDTGNAELQEGNNWGDRYWGVDLKTGYGENRLGRIIMKVRWASRLP